MAVPPNVSEQILTAQLKLANMVDANIVSLQGGSLFADWIPSIKAWVNINLVSWLNGIGDNSSSSFQSAYSCMNYFVGTYAGGTIDPNAQNPGVVIDVTETVIASTTARIAFTDTLTINWQTDIVPEYTKTYASLFGNGLPIYSFYSSSSGEYDANQPQLAFVTAGGLITTATCNQPGTWLLILS